MGVKTTVAALSFAKQQRDGLVEEVAMKRISLLIEPNAARSAKTIGELERLAGIGSSHEERFEFWRQFAPMKDDAFDAGRAELYRRILTRPIQTPGGGYAAI